MSSPSIAPRQIVYLEHDTTRLYAEVIDIVYPKQLCWARPLMLVELLNDLTADRSDHLPTNRLPLDGKGLYALKDSPDIIWPLCLFKAALDIEVFQLLSNLQKTDSQPNQDDGMLSMQQFVQQLWAAYPEQFNRPSTL